MAEPALLTNEYSGEHIVRRDVRVAVESNGFTVESYGIADRGGKRTVTVGLDGFGGDARPAFLTALEETLNTHGYDLDSVKITAKCVKDVSNQTVLKFATDGHPDNV
jgi:hypothetical protein